MKILFSLIVTFYSVLFGSSYANYSIDKSRTQLTNDLNAIDKKYADLIRPLEKNGFDYDSKKIKKIRKKHNREIALRMRQSTDADAPRHKYQEYVEKKFKGKIGTSGSNPRNQQADMDYFSTDKDSYESMRKDAENRGFTVKETEYNFTNEELDAVTWKADKDLTPEQRKLKYQDNDSYKFPGGLKDTGMINFQSNKEGAGKDPYYKSIHAVQDNDPKTFGKGIVKQHDNAFSAKKGIKGVKKIDDPKNIYEKSKKLQAYKRPNQMGVDIYKLTDSDAVKEQKMKQFYKDGLELGAKTQKVLNSAERRKTKYRQILANSMKDPRIKKSIQDRIDLGKEQNKFYTKKMHKDLKKLDLDLDINLNAVDGTNKNRNNISPPQIKNKNTLTNTNKKALKNNYKGGGFSAADMLVNAYQAHESAQETIKNGGNSFLAIDKNDNPYYKNTVAYGSALVEATPFGGAWGAGKQAEAEEKKRILDAMKKGQTVNPVVSMVRSSGWGLWYVAKGMVTGVFEYTSDKAAKLAWEIKQGKDAKRKAEKAEEIARNTQKKLEELKEKKRLEEEEKLKNPPVVFFEAGGDENAFRQQMQAQRDENARNDKYQASLSSQDAINTVKKEQAAFGRSMQGLAQGLQQVQTALVAEQYAQQQADTIASDRRFDARKEAFAQANGTQRQYQPDWNVPKGGSASNGISNQALEACIQRSRYSRYDDIHMLRMKCMEELSGKTSSSPEYRGFKHRELTTKRVQANNDVNLGMDANSNSMTVQNSSSFNDKQRDNICGNDTSNNGYWRVAGIGYDGGYSIESKKPTTMVGLYIIRDFKQFTPSCQLVTTTTIQDGYISVHKYYKKGLVSQTTVKNLKTGKVISQN